MKKILFTLITSVALLIGAIPALAETVTPNPSVDYYYLFSLHVTGGQLMANTPAYTIMTGTRPTIAAGPYTLAIIDHLGAIATSISFSVTTSTVKVPVPYQTTGVKAVISKAGIMLLEIDTSLSSTCNQNGICDSAVGEDQYQCPSDCFVQPIVTPEPQAYTSGAPVSVQTQPLSQNTIEASSIRIWILVVVAMIGLAVLVILRRHWIHL